MNRLTELFMARRGFDWDALRTMENPSHGVMADVDAAIDRLAFAKSQGWKVVILPDFDMDGIASGVLGYAGLSELGFDVELFEPNPSAGYGVSPAEVDRLVAEHPGVRMIVTCDVGIGCRLAVERARAYGIEVVVTDHHMEREEASPRGLVSALVDPVRKDDPYEHSSICGAHVLWQVLDAYARKYGNVHMVDQIARLRVFAGIGTISDSMPLLYENRQLVRDALSIIQMVWSCGNEWFIESIGGSHAYRGAFRGLFNAVSAWGTGEDKPGKISKVADIDEMFIGFYLAPMFNSCKRMDEPMSTAFGVFFSDESEGCVARLMTLNAERRALVDEKMDAMLFTPDPILAPYAYIVDAPGGVLGLLAGKLVSKTGLPAIVVASDGQGGFHGSGRSPEWYRFQSRTKDAAEYVAGHDVAFGCRFSSYESLKQLVEFVRVDSEEVLAQLALEGHLADDPDVRVSTLGDGDVAIDIPLISEFVSDMSRFKPFGKGFAEPDIALRFDASEAQWIPLSEGKHVKARLPYGLDMLIWNVPGFLDEGSPDGVIEARGGFSFNDFRGNRSLQFVANRLAAVDE